MHMARPRWDRNSWEGGAWQYDDQAAEGRTQARASKRTAFIGFEKHCGRRVDGANGRERGRTERRGKRPGVMCVQQEGQEIGGKGRGFLCLSENERKGRVWEDERLFYV
eukprot:601365-Hanusia_phi.AAC.1